METRLEEDRKYDHSVTQALLGDVREFFQGLRLAVPERGSVRAAAEKGAAQDPVELFRIEKGCEPIYASCSGGSDMEENLILFQDRLEELLDHLIDLLNRNKDLDEESQKNLNNYARAVHKAVKVYENQRRRKTAGLQVLETVAEIREALRQLFSEIVGSYIIVVLCDGLYERVKNDAGPIYKMVIREVNGFLAGLGVYTETVTPGERPNPELVEPTPDSAENFTDDYQKFEAVDKVCRYPYLFADGTKIIDGRARIWRRRD